MLSNGRLHARKCPALEGLTVRVQLSAFGVSPAIRGRFDPLPPTVSLTDATTAMTCSYCHAAITQTPLSARVQQNRWGSHHLPA